MGLSSLAVDGASSGFDFCPTPCAICGKPGTTAQADEQLYPAKVTFDDLNPDAFTARRHAAKDLGPPHYRIVRCRQCGLVRSDPTAPAAILDRLYRESELTYAPETANLRYTYGRYITKAKKHGSVNQSFLEIGCGDGFMLEEASRLGFRDVTGVEPSTAALQHASVETRPRIRAEMFRPCLFQSQSFDLIALFQTFDHISDPAAALVEFHRLLRPGGRVLFLQHNVKAISACILGERSPIIDIGHTYLYDPATLGSMVRLHRFDPVEQGSVWNRYSIRYLISLMPISPTSKQFLRSWAARVALEGLNISAPLGNMYGIAKKRE